MGVWIESNHVDMVHRVVPEVMGWGIIWYLSRGYVYDFLGFKHLGITERLITARAEEG